MCFVNSLAGNNLSVVAQPFATLLWTNATILCWFNKFLAYRQWYIGTSAAIHRCPQLLHIFFGNKVFPDLCFVHCL